MNAKSNTIIVSTVRDRRQFLSLQKMILISPDEIEYSTKHNIFRFKSPNCKLDKGVELNNINYGWSMWLEGKVSAVPKGYVLCKSKPVAYIVQNKFWKQEYQ